MNKLKELWNKHGWSIIHTFIGAFLVALLPVIDQLTIENVETGAIIGVFVAVMRQAVKVVVQYLIARFFSK